MTTLDQKALEAADANFLDATVAHIPEDFVAERARIKRIAEKIRAYLAAATAPNEDMVERAAEIICRELFGFPGPYDEKQSPLTPYGQACGAATSLAAAGLLSPSPNEMQEFEADLKNPEPLNKAHREHLESWKREQSPNEQMAKALEE